MVMNIERKSALIGVAACAVAIVAGVAPVVSYAYRKQVPTVVQKSCSVELADKRYVEGVRTYEYSYMEIMGIRFVNWSPKNVKETTEIKVDQAMTISAFWPDTLTRQDYILDDSQHGLFTVPKAPSYIFVLDGGFTLGVVDYENFCK